MRGVRSPPVRATLLEVVGRSDGELDGQLDVVDAGDLEAVDVMVIGEPWRQLGHRTDEQVGHAAGLFDVARTSPNVSGAVGDGSDASTTAVLPPHRTGANSSDNPASGARRRRDDADDAGRFRRRDVEERTGHRVHPAQDLRQLVGLPAQYTQASTAVRRPRQRRRRCRHHRFSSATNCSRWASSISVTR